jgi:hypothetical protein
MDALADKVAAIHRSLDASAINHALGGAIALAFCTSDPRGTSAIDINVFAGPEQVEQVFAALPESVETSSHDADLVKRDGQVRLWWGETPVDLFFAYHDFHHQAGERLRTMPFGDVDVPVLSCTDLAVFKAFFARRKDWGDIADMAVARSIDGVEVLDWIERLLGRDDERYAKLKESLAAKPEADRTYAMRDALGDPRKDGDAPRASQ